MAQIFPNHRHFLSMKIIVHKIDQIGFLTLCFTDPLEALRTAELSNDTEVSLSTEDEEIGAEETEELVVVTLTLESYIEKKKYNYTHTLN